MSGEGLRLPDSIWARLGWLMAALSASSAWVSPASTRAQRIASLALSNVNRAIVKIYHRDIDYEAGGSESTRSHLRTQGTVPQDQCDRGNGGPSGRGFGVRLRVK